MIARQFQERLREAVTEQRITFPALAKRSGYSRCYIERVANGKRANPTLQFVETVSQVLGRNPAWMLGLGKNHEQ